ncbi:MAG: CAP domain-containing protein [Gaiellaceae bacterium]
MRVELVRRVGLVLMVLVAAGALAGGGLAAARQPQVALSPLEHGVLAEINAFRVAHRLPTLRLSAPLSTAARQHSQEMALDGYFAHTSYSGQAFWKRIASYYPSTPWSYWSVGENLLWSSPGVDAMGALQMWVNSPEHLANLMNKNWREIGVSAVHTSTAGGPYQGLGVTIVTTDFGVRR